MDFGAEAAPHLLQGNLVARLVLGGDQVGHGLGLAEVHLAVQEGPEGEFPGTGHAAPTPQEMLQNLLLDIGGAMAGDLHHVFARIRPGCPEDACQYLVKHAFPIADGSQMYRMAGSLRKRFAAHRMKTGTGQVNSRWSRKPDHCNSSRSGGCGEGDNGVFVKHGVKEWRSTLFQGAKILLIKHLHTHIRP